MDKVTITPKLEADKPVAKALEVMINQPENLAEFERLVRQQMVDLFLYGLNPPQP